MTRVVCWFSAGAASAVATKLMIGRTAGELVIYRADTGSEHPDNTRFHDDCAAWFGRPVELIRSERYRDTWHVWTETRYLNGPEGMRCTVELKKKPRYAVERPDDVQVFGYTVEERERAERFRRQNPGVELSTPLIDAGLTKSDCIAIIDRAGIVLPAMYLLGYRNNNCIGCPNGGMGYWNKIRRDYPEVFARMAALERELGRTCIRDDAGPVWLDELDPRRGKHSDDPEFECSLMCALVEEVIAP